MRMGFDTTQARVIYDWTVEIIRDGDVIDTLSDTTYQDARDTAAVMLRDCYDAASHTALIGLVRDDRRGRSWAYVNDGVMDAWCRDASGGIVAAVPKRIIAEVRRGTR